MLLVFLGKTTFPSKKKKKAKKKIYFKKHFMDYLKMYLWRGGLFLLPSSPANPCNPMGPEISIVKVGKEQPGNI